jgi:hypothetical protein
VTALILAKVFIAVWICQRGYLFLSSDDFCRIDIAYRWTQRHFFATWDHIWLAGQFYIQGAFMHLFRDPMVSVRLSALLFSTLSAVVLYFLTRAVFDRRTGCLVLALFAVLPYPTWLSVSGHPNPFFLAFAVAGVLFLVTSRGRWPYLFAAGASFCAATAFRYEGLLLGGVFAVWVFTLVATDRRRWNPLDLFLHLALMSIPFWYFAVWAWSCYRTHGDALLFLRNAHAMSPDTIRQLDLLGRFLWYPRVLAGAEFVDGVRNEYSPALFFLSLTGIPLSLVFLRERRGVVARYTFVVLFNFLLLTGTVVRGGGNVMAQRVVVLTQILLLPFAGALLFLLWDRLGAVEAFRGRLLGRRVVRAGLVALVVLLAAVEMRKTFDFPRGMPGVDPNALSLSRELHRRFLARDPDPDDVAAILLDGKITPEAGWVFGTMGRYFEKTLHLRPRDIPAMRSALENKDEILYVSFEDVPVDTSTMQKLASQPPYTLWMMENHGPGRIPAFFEPAIRSQ